MNCTAFQFRAAVVALATLLIYAVTLFPTFPPVGDAADYCALISHGHLSTRGSHIGYYLFAWPFVAVGQLVGVSPVAVLNSLAAMCTAATVYLAAILFRRLGVGDTASLLGAATYGTSGAVWYHALFGEVQALTMLLLVLALLLATSARTLLSGATMGAAVLVSQLALLAAPAAVALLIMRRSLRPVLPWMTVATGVFLAGSVPVLTDHLAGSRSVVALANRYPPAPLAHTSALAGLRVLESFTILSPLLVLAVARVRKQAPALLVLLLALLPTLFLAARRVGHVEYGFVWIPLFLPLSAFAGCGLAHLTGRLAIQKHPAAGLLAVSLAATLAFTSYVLPKRRDAIMFSHVLDELPRLVGDAPVVAYPHVGFLLVHRNHPEVANVWLSQWSPPPSDSAALSTLVRKNGCFWVLEHDPQPSVLRTRLVATFAGSLSADQRSDLTNESDTPLAVHLKDTLKIELETIKQWKNARLLRFCEPLDASRAPTAPTIQQLTERARRLLTTATPSPAATGASSLP